jgi:signal peptidase II
LPSNEGEKGKEIEFWGRCFLSYCGCEKDLRIVFVSIIIVVLDQLSKIFIKGFSIPFLNVNFAGMTQGQRIPIIGDFFRLTFIENPGMAFGYDPGSQAKLWISLFSLVASAGLFIYLYYIRNQNLSLRLSIAFILGGAVGNLIDRMFYGVFYGYAPLFYGKVVDFLDFDFFNISLLGRSYDRWPIFNFADAAVSIGVLILILFYKRHNKEKEEEQTLETNLQVEGNTGQQIIKEDLNGETDNRKEIPD